MVVASLERVQCCSCVTGRCGLAAELAVLAEEHRSLRTALGAMIEVLKRIADAPSPKERATDAEILFYMTQLPKPLPPIREIAMAVGWSHSHILKHMPLSSAYFRHHNGRGVRAVRHGQDDSVMNG